MRSDELQEPGADAGHTIEVFQTAERALHFPIGQNGFGQPRTDLWEASELRRAGPINIDPLIQVQGPCLAHGAITLCQR
jgi:hypothetical protein